MRARHPDEPTPIATPVSGHELVVRPQAAPPGRGSTVAPTVACSSLRKVVRHTALFVPVALLTMLSGSCLITTDPEFNDPVQTAPFLVVDQATPDPRKIVVLQQADNGPLTFAGFVRSEDVGDDLEVRLLKDYGKPGSGGKPYVASSPGITVQPGTWGQGARPVSATWTDDELGLAPGCHRLTLMVSHKFADNGCPDDAGDYDAITWTVVRCAPEGCLPLDPEIPCLLTDEGEAALAACPPADAAPPESP